MQTNVSSHYIMNLPSVITIAKKDHILPELHEEYLKNNGSRSNCSYLQQCNNSTDSPSWCLKSLIIRLQILKQDATRINIKTGCSAAARQTAADPSNWPACSWGAAAAAADAASAAEQANRMRIQEIKRRKDIEKQTCRKSKATTFGRKETGSLSEETCAVKSFIKYIS